MSKSIKSIYDRAIKRIFGLSDGAIIDLINGLFDVDHPRDSRVTYPNKEFINNQLGAKIADVIIVINDVYTYHIEAQMGSMDDIVFRAFDYGYLYASSTHSEGNELTFPEPVILYIGNKQNIAEKHTIRIRFGSQGYFDYKVSVFRYLGHDAEELNRKKMVVLIPFQVLRLKAMVDNAKKQKKTIDNDQFEKLQNEVKDDILKSIEVNLQVNNITYSDAVTLRDLTLRLYEHIIKDYLRVGGDEDMSIRFDDALELPFADEIIRLHNELEERDKQLEDRNKQLEDRDKEKEKAKQITKLYYRENVPPSEIAQRLSIDLAEVEDFIS